MENSLKEKSHIDLTKMLENLEAKSRLINQEEDLIKVELLSRWPNLIEEKDFIPSFYTPEMIDEARQAYLLYLENLKYSR